MRSRVLFASTAALLSLAPLVASAADTVPSIDLRGFHAPIDPASGVHVQPADSPGTGEWSVGLWTSYAYRPITLRDPTTNKIAFDVIRHQLSGDLTASVGLFHR